jgi:hypothetical protein
MGAVDRDCEIIRAWIRREVLGSGTVPNIWQSNRVRYRGAQVHSYGEHFPLAEIVRPRRGRPIILLNGDRWGPNSRTSRHQTAAQQAAAELETFAETIIVPFSALDGAGIVHSSIRPIEVRPDQTATLAHRYAIPPDLFGDPLELRPSPFAAAWQSPAIAFTETRRITCDVENRGPASFLEREGIPELERRAATIVRTVTYRESETRYSYPRDSRGYTTSRPYRWARNYDAPRITYTVNGRGADMIETETGPALVITSWHHVLGDSLFRADRMDRRTIPCPEHVAESDGSKWCGTCGRPLDRPGIVTGERKRRARFISSFDYNERAPLYFLAAIPHRSRAETVTSAIEDLAPPAVHAAYARGLDVRRQGDIFAVPTPLTDVDVYARAVTRSRLATWTHSGTPRPGEAGHVKPYSKRTRDRMAREVRAEYRAIRLEMFQRCEDHYRERRPWRAEKRRRIAGLRVSIARHRERIAAGDAWVNDGRWHTNYTAERAEEMLRRCEAALAAVQAESRARRRDRAAGSSHELAVWNGADGRRLSDGNTSRASLERARNTVHGRYRMSPDYGAVRRALAVYGTAHTATEVVHARGGAVYLRGIMRHVPAVAGENRGRDHAPVKLDGARWYLAVRNTVPRQ